MFYIAQSALHPWFVGAGFGLYINCRTQLEAWDIEVAFRRIVQRRAGSVAAAMLALIAGGASLMLWHEPALSQEVEDSAFEDPGFSGFWTDEEVEPAMETVMASDALHTMRETERWQRIDTDEPAEPDTNSEKRYARLVWSMPWRRFRQVHLLHRGVRPLDRGVALVVLIIFATRDRWLPYLDYAPPSLSPRQRVILASGEVAAEDLPDDIAGEAAKLWRAGERRTALSPALPGQRIRRCERLWTCGCRKVRLKGCLHAGGCRESVRSARRVFPPPIVDTWIVLRLRRQDAGRR